MVTEQKITYFRDKLVQSESCKDLFKTCNELLGKTTETVLPTNIAPEKLPSALNDFFIEKVETIRNDLDTSKAQVEFSEFNGNSFLACFKPVTEETIKRLILDSPKSHCELDPLPINLFIECIDVLLPYITTVINWSLERGTVPELFKQAIVRPIIKRTTLTKTF